MNRATTTVFTIVGGTALIALTIASACQSQSQPPHNGQEQVQQAGNGQQPQAQQSQVPKAVFDVVAQFTASGFMGDGEQGTKFIHLMEAWKDKPHSAPSCIKVIYSPGPNGWGGVYWQNKPDNWGD